jgi:hypothetical protein
MRWVLEHDDVRVALLSEIRHVSKAVAQRGAWLHPICIELAVLDANVPTQCMEWGGAWRLQTTATREIAES